MTNHPVWYSEKTVRTLPIKISSLSAVNPVLCLTEVGRVDSVGPIKKGTRPLKRGLARRLSAASGPEEPVGGCRKQHPRGDGSRTGIERITFRPSTHEEQTGDHC
jgi:hypothetical protein